MSLRSWGVVGGLLLLPACRGPVPAAPPPEAGSLEGRGVLLEVENPRAGERTLFFDLPDADLWFQPAPEDPERARYRADLAARIGEAALGQASLIARQAALFGALNGKPIQRESENGRAILDGRAGRLRTLNLLEWRLLQCQARRYPLLAHPTECAAFILRGKGRLHVYLSGADAVGSKFRSEIRERVVRDRQAGFAFVALFHNHPFLFDRVVGDRLYTTEDSLPDIGGAVAPSLTDVQLWRRLRADLDLRGAWITNGLDSGDFSSDDFEVLSARD